MGLEEKDINVVMLFIKLIAEGVGVVAEIQQLAKRVEAGEEITAEEIEVARQQINGAMNEWNAEKDRRDGPDNG